MTSWPQMVTIFWTTNRNDLGAGTVYVYRNQRCKSSVFRRTWKFQNRTPIEQKNVLTPFWAIFHHETEQNGHLERFFVLFKKTFKNAFWAFFHHKNAPERVRTVQNVRTKNKIKLENHKNNRTSLVFCSAVKFRTELWHLSFGPVLFVC